MRRAPVVRQAGGGTTEGRPVSRVLSLLIGARHLKVPGTSSSGWPSILALPCGGAPAAYLPAVPLYERTLGQAAREAGCLALLRVEIAAFHVPNRRRSNCVPSSFAGRHDLGRLRKGARLCGSNPPQRVSVGGPDVIGVRCPLELGLSSLRRCLAPSGAWHRFVERPSSRPSVVKDPSPSSKLQA